MRMAHTTAPGLVRGLRRWDLVALVINSILGTGIFGLPSIVHRLVGPDCLWAFLACAVVIMAIVLCFAEVGSRFTATGGPYLYAREVFGPVIGFEIGWLLWVAQLTTFATSGNLLVLYLGYFWPAVGAGVWRAVVIAGVVLALTSVTLLGVRTSAIVSNILTLGKMLPLLFIPTVSRGVTYAVVCTYGCDGGRISPTRCAVIDAVLDGR